MLTANSGNQRLRHFAIQRSQQFSIAKQTNRMSAFDTRVEWQESFQRMHANGDDQLLIPSFLPGEAAALDALYGPDLIVL